MNPKHDKQIREELATVASDLQAEITAAQEGMVIDV